jgi:hypothetical protein
MKSNFITLLLMVILVNGIVYGQQNQLHINLSQVAPLIDGVIGEEEWVDAKEIKLLRTAEWKIDVLVKYDSEFIYVAFRNLTYPQMARINAEILVQTKVDKNEWDDTCYWFHSSYSNCSSLGEYYNWDFCSNDPPGWKANTFPFKNGNNNMEFKISFSKLNLIPTKGKQLKMAFKLSNPLEQHTYWPETASISNPISWGFIEF